MSLGIRPMRSGEEDAIAVLIRQLPKDIGLDVVPKISGDSLRDAKGVAEVMLAVDAGLILGVCLWTLTYSSWLGQKGIYISDLYVLPHARGRKIGEKLLRGVIKESDKRGAAYVKMEVERSNLGAQKFYGRLGFKYKPDDQYYLLGPDQFKTLLKES